MVQPLNFTVIQGVLGARDDLIAFLDAQIQTDVNTRLNSVTGSINDIDDRILSGLGGPIDAIGRIIDDIVDGITDALNLGADGIQGLFDTTVEHILTPMIGAFGVVLDFLVAIETKIVDGLEETISLISTTIEDVFEKATDLVSMAVEQVADTIEDLKDSAVGGIAAAGGVVGDAIGGLIPGVLNFLAPDMAKRLAFIVDEFESTPDLPQGLKDITAPGLLPIAGAGAFVLAIAILPTVAAMITATTGPHMLKVTQNMQTKVRSQLLPAGDVIASARRGFTDEVYTSSVLSKQGLTDLDQALLRRLSRLPLTTQEEIALWLRESTTDSDLDKRLDELGFDDRQITSLKELAFPIPGVGDIIRMAVREVFSPEIAERFGQFEEIPDEYLLWSRRQGLTDFWARNFWAAHWELPSIQQGFEMLHRREITEADLSALFVALDVMPFWRGPLQAIAFRPLTRVDVRRMHITGVLSNQEVLESYSDLGYSPSNAERMTAFTIALTEKSRQPKQDRERDLTKAEILSVFKEGLITEDEATSALEQMGFDSTESELLISRIELQLAVAERNTKVRLILDKFRNGSITFVVAQDRLQELDLGAAEKETQITKLIRLRDSANTLPAKGDFRRWLVNELVTPDEFTEGLRLLGFADIWIDKFLVEGGQSRARKEAQTALERGNEFDENGGETESVPPGSPGFERG